MKDRLLAFLDYEKLSPARFADAIAVQRSSISHILSGRNKPSFDFIQKTLEAFPYLNADWFLTGNGPMLKEKDELQNDLFSGLPERQAGRDSNNIGITTSSGEQVVKANEQQFAGDEAEPLIKTFDSPVNPGKKLERIVVFYSDKTFLEYLPER